MARIKTALLLKIILIKTSNIKIQHGKTFKKLKLILKICIDEKWLYLLEELFKSP